ncbi:hypothetical protein GW17_00004390 [Ensete ventricosum]|nr:hypothetical protein GW17_00004390 [Ensete ventricosum]
MEREAKRTRGSGEREAVLGLNSKMSSKGGQERFLALPMTTRSCFSDRLIHDAHVTGPAESSPSITPSVASFVVSCSLPSLLVGDLALKSEDLVRTALRRIGVKGVEIRKEEQLQTVDALIIPGGESTTMAKLAHYHNLVRPLLSLQSFETELSVPKLAEEEGGPNGFRGVFIRAPAILEEMLVSRERVIVAVRQGNLLGTAFHPELTSDLRW